MMTAVLFMAGVLCGVTPQEFESHEYRHEKHLFYYRLFVPHPLETGRRYPLLVWLHGLGANGDDNQKQVGEAGFWLNLADGSYFILMLQCPPKDPAWSSINIDVTVDILKKTIYEKPVDIDRIYLAGLSSGGNGCWGMAMRYPELFAAVVPMASSGGDVSRAAHLAKIPIWAFINECELTKGVDVMAAAVTNLGGNIHLTIMQNPGHDSWSVPMHGGVIEWMLAQRRGALCWTPPNHAVWQWWQILVLPCGFLVFFRVGWHLEQRRRRIQHSSTLETSDDDFVIGSISHENGAMDTDFVNTQEATS
jgi:poly(3-hydroxybutyrate) depolymerase